jgi:alanyl-tRNA synthetase
VRRIEAMTGYEAYQFDNHTQDSLGQIAQMTKSNNAQAVEKVAQLIKQQKELEKQIASFQKQLASNQGDDLISQAQEVNGVKNPLYPSSKHAQYHRIFLRIMPLHLSF